MMDLAVMDLSVFVPWCGGRFLPLIHQSVVVLCCYGANVGCILKAPLSLS